LCAIGSSGALTNTVAGGVVAAGLTNAGTVYLSSDTTITGSVYNQGAFSPSKPVNNSSSPSFVLSNQLVNAGSLIISMPATTRTTCSPSSSPACRARR